MPEMSEESREQQQLAGRPFKWTRRRKKAAALVADGGFFREIAVKVGISDRQLRRWRRHPEFAARVDALLEGYAEELLRKWG